MSSSWKRSARTITRCFENLITWIQKHMTYRFHVNSLRTREREDSGWCCLTSHSSKFPLLLVGSTTHLKSLNVENSAYKTPNPRWTSISSWTLRTIDPFAILPSDNPSFDKSDTCDSYKIPRTFPVFSYFTAHLLSLLRLPFSDTHTVTKFPDFLLSFHSTWLIIFEHTFSFFSTVLL